MHGTWDFSVKTIYFIYDRNIFTLTFKPYAYIFFLHSLSAILPPLARWKNEILNIWGGARITLARARGVCAVVRTPLLTAGELP